VNARWVLWYLLSPSQLLCYAAAAGALLLALGRVRAGRALCIGGGLGLLVFGVLPGAQWIARPLEARFAAVEPRGAVGGIILLGGAEATGASDATGEPQLGSHGSRYVTFLRLANRHPEARLVYSGGPLRIAGRGPLGAQSAVAVAILGGMGLESPRLRYDTQSRDTCDHPGNVRALAAPRAGETWIVVTSALHMPRAIACFRASGWDDVVPYPTDYKVVPGAWGIGTFRAAENLALLDVAAHEWLGLAYYRWSGRTREFFPAPERRAPGAPAFDPPGGAP
jgi:uncharacterized SAM-binding protein YcdF (DUF218 family)